MNFRELRDKALGNPEAIREYRDRVADLHEYCHSDPTVSALCERAYEAEKRVPRWRR